MEPLPKLTTELNNLRHKMDAILTAVHNEKSKQEIAETIFDAIKSFQSVNDSVYKWQNHLFHLANTIY